jgi:predicted nuclease of predicted toxin-antitoxin system
MRLLFDQNISFRLLKKISDLYPDAKQVRELSFENATDLEIFEFAIKNNYTIVTFDSDFCDLNSLKDFPTRIIWLRTGNTTTDHLASVFKKRYELISSFMNEDNGCLEIAD